MHAPYLRSLSTKRATRKRPRLAMANERSMTRERRQEQKLISSEGERESGYSECYEKATERKNKKRAVTVTLVKYSKSLI